MLNFAYLLGPNNGSIFESKNKGICIISIVHILVCWWVFLNSPLPPYFYIKRWTPIKACVDSAASDFPHGKFLC